MAKKKGQSVSLLQDVQKLETEGELFFQHGVSGRFFPQGLY